MQSGRLQAGLLVNARPQSVLSKYNSTNRTIPYGTIVSISPDMRGFQLPTLGLPLGVLAYRGDREKGGCRAFEYGNIVIQGVVSIAPITNVPANTQVYCTNQGEVTAVATGNISLQGAYFRQTAYAGFPAELVFDLTATLKSFQTIPPVTPEPPAIPRPTVTPNALENFSNRPLRQNSLTSGLIVAYSGGANREFIGNVSGFVGDNGLNAVTPTITNFPNSNEQYSRAISTRNTPRTYVQFPISNPQALTDFTILFAGRVTDTQGRIMAGATAVGDSGRVFEWSTYGPASAENPKGLIYFETRNSQGTVATNFFDQSFRHNEYQVNVLQRHGSLFKGYLDGAMVRYGGVGDFTYPITPTNILLGSYWQDFRNRNDQDSHFAFIWNRALTEQEIFAVSQNPYLIFEDPYRDSLDAKPVPSKKVSIYTVGNSLTDTLNLNRIRNNVINNRDYLLHGRKMIPGSPLWFNFNRVSEGITEETYGFIPNAASNFQWDAVMVQPFTHRLNFIDPSRVDPADGDLQVSKAIYQQFLTNSPNAVLYVHSTWPSRPKITGGYAAQWLKPYTNDATVDNESKAYFERLRTLLLLEFPGKTIRIMPTGDVLLRIAQEITNGNIPEYSSITQVYNDDVHLYGFGEFICACVAYSTLFRQEPTNLPTTGFNMTTEQGVTVSAASIAFIRSVVWDVVSNHPLAGVL